MKGAAIFAVALGAGFMAMTALRVAANVHDGDPLVRGGVEENGFLALALLVGGILALTLTRCERIERSPSLT